MSVRDALPFPLLLTAGPRQATRDRPVIGPCAQPTLDGVPPAGFKVAGLAWIRPNLSENLAGMFLRIRSDIYIRKFINCQTLLSIIVEKKRLLKFDF